MFTLTHEHVLFHVCTYGITSHALQKEGDTDENGEIFVLAEQKKKKKNTKKTQLWVSQTLSSILPLYCHVTMTAIYPPRGGGLVTK